VDNVSRPWPQIQADIDAGKLSPMGLIQTDSLDIGKNHQVLAYAYEKSGQRVRLFIYDPNETAEVRLEFDITATDGEVKIDRYIGDVLANKHRIYCFFRINGYTPKMPPFGRPKKTVREAIRASLTPPYSVRAAVLGNNAAGSLTSWMRSL
jgi:hypothetical protein